MEKDGRSYFSALYGNAAVKRRLGAAIEADTLPHAFLIIGPDGSGKRTLARELAAALNCESRGVCTSPLPCHSCNSCRRIAENNFTDIKKLIRTDGKVTVGVDEVRLFREDMFLSATESTHKIYVIEEADKLTVNAQNALLTVLEEPPSNVVILLLAESADKILTTIKSRAQTISMQRFEADELREYVIKHNDKASLYSKTDEDALLGAIMSADGRIGRAFDMLSDKLSEESRASRSTAERLISAMHPGAKYSELYTALSQLPTARTDFTEAVEEIMLALRDLLLVKFDKDAPLLFYTSRDRALDSAAEMSTKRLIALYEAFKGAVEDAARNVSTSTICADLGAKIRFI